MSEAAVSYDFEQLEPSEPPPRDAPARLLATAVAEADALREEARAEGREQGLREGREEAAEQMRGASAALAEALRGIEELRAGVAEAVEGDAVALGLALAGKILAATLEVRSQAVVDVVQGALRRVGGQRTITILVSPEDVETVREALGTLQTQAAGLEPLDLQADARVARGGAIVRTVEGEVDARIQTQLERAREVALAELQGGAAA